MYQKTDLWLYKYAKLHNADKKTTGITNMWADCSVIKQILLKYRQLQIIHN